MFKKMMVSEWKLSAYAIAAFIGVGIMASIITQNVYQLLGGLTALVIMVTANALYVFYKRYKRNKLRKAMYIE